MSDVGESQRLIDALLDAGWTVVGERSGIYKRLGLRDGRKGCSLVVPLDPTAPDHGELLAAVFATLETAMRDGQSARQVLHRMKPELYP